MALTGCGNDSSVAMGDAADYDDATLYVLAKKENSLYNADYAKKLKNTLDEDESIFAPYEIGYNYAEFRIKELNEKKAVIASLPISDELKDEYLATIKIATDYQYRTIELYNNLYKGGFNDYFRSTNPKIFKKLDEADNKLKLRAEYLAEATNKYKAADETYDASYRKTEATLRNIESKVASFIIDNEIRISKKRVSVSDVEYAAEKPSTGSTCKSDDPRYGHYTYVKTTGLCHNVQLVNYTPTGQFTDPQIEALDRLIVTLTPEHRKAAMENDVNKVLRARAEATLKKKTAIADDRFGSEWRLKTAKKGAERSLNRASHGVYDSRRGEYVPLVEGKTNYKLNRAIKALLVKAGIPTIKDYKTSDSAFNAENATKALNQILEAEYKSADVFTDIDDDGSVNLGDISSDTIKVLRYKNVAGELVATKLKESGKNEDDQRLFTYVSKTKSNNILLTTEVMASELLYGRSHFRDENGRMLHFGNYIKKTKPSI